MHITYCTVHAYYNTYSVIRSSLTEKTGNVCTKEQRGVYLQSVETGNEGKPEPNRGHKNDQRRESNPPACYTMRGTRGCTGV